MTFGKHEGKNLIQLFQENGSQLPFKARRWSWSDQTTLIVTDVKIGKYPYGKVFGHIIRGGIVIKKTHEVSCGGCYQWKVVE